MRTSPLYEAALEIAEEHSYDIYDALVVAAALQAGPTILYSGDLRDRHPIEKQLTIRNPVAKSSD
jgi:predicted nucleic acid-binding protein